MKIALGADHGGYELKEEIKKHLEGRGIPYVDFGTNSTASIDYPDVAVPPCKAVQSGECDYALLFCGTGVGIHIAASKCPHVHAGVVESVPAALRAITGNGVNVLAMGAFYVAPAMGCDIADAYLNAELGSGYEWWKNFYEFHKLAIDELEAFDYEEYKKNGFKVNKLGDFPLKLEKKPD